MNLPLPNGRTLEFADTPLVMGIINCTNDSFYAPSRAMADIAVEKALEAVASGAAIVDFGGESTRPGAQYVSAGEELDRVIPVIQKFRRYSDVPISIDTRKAVVAQAALEAGADIINDISALQDDPALPAICAEKQAAVILMHKKGIPLTMQNSPYYDNVIQEVKDFLYQAAQKAIDAGIGKDRIIIDPGIGFGKRVEDNLMLLANLSALNRGDYPVLIGLSRKSFIGKITNREPEERLAGTLAATVMVMYQGIHIVRVHDVAETVDAIKVFQAIKKTGNRITGE